MTRVLITGSTQGIGCVTAQQLLADGHQVVIHARSERRLGALADLRRQGADAVVGDLSDEDETRALAVQVNRLGHMDAVIHNAGVMSGPGLAAVNVVAPYLLTVLVTRPRRLVYFSSGMHLSGRPATAGLDRAGAGPQVTYSDTKLMVTPLASAVARHWPDVYCNAVNPGWVPTRMGGRHAPDRLDDGAATQAWLATSDDPAARTSGSYWFHRRRSSRHPAAGSLRFQDDLIEALGRWTGERLE
jgi:NAD(P)-dependent dehydrogenase (short-subunit alcohol dehydrogenase family)